MFLRALIVWCGLLIAAIANGLVREALIIPAVGEAAGHVVSTPTLSAAILGIAWLTVRWISPASTEDALRIGGVWLVLTLAFEFLAGHYLFGHSWSTLLADYDVLGGRTWVLVLMTTMLAPFLSARGHGLVARREYR